MVTVKDKEITVRIEIVRAKVQPWVAIITIVGSIVAEVLILSGNA